MNCSVQDVPVTHVTTTWLLFRQYLCIYISQTFEVLQSFFFFFLPCCQTGADLRASDRASDRMTDWVGRAKAARDPSGQLPCYLLFLCRIIILRLFTPWTLIGIANADVQWLSIRIKDANNGKWGHVSKAAPFPWLFITASSRENFILTVTVLYLLELSHCHLWKDTRDFWVSFKQQSWFRSGTKDVLLDWKHFTTQKEKSWTENISDSCLDSVQRYCEESWDRWSDNWRQSKMRARNRSACEARRLHEALTLQQKREEEDGRVGGGQHNWIINEKDAF